MANLNMKGISFFGLTQVRGDSKLPVENTFLHRWELRLTINSIVGDWRSCFKQQDWQKYLILTSYFLDFFTL